MAVSFPTSIDSLTNPTATTDTATLTHAGQHSDVNDAVEALETKVGIDSSAVATSLDYKLTSASSSNPGHLHTLTAGVTGTLPVANGGTGVTASTGTVAVVLSTSPTLVTPVLGVATATSINKVAITAPATSATLTVANGKTLTVSDTTTLATNAITFAGGEVVTFTATNALTLTTTGSTTVTLPTSGTLATLAGSETLTNKGISGSTNTLTNIGTTAITDAAVTSRKMKLDQIQYATSTTNMATASGSYIDYTGLSVTFTPNVASNLLVLVQVTAYAGSAAGGQGNFIVDLGGATQGNDPLMTFVEQDNVAGNFDVTMSGFLWITGVASSSTTVKVRVKSASGATINTRYGSLTVIPFAS